MHRLIDKEKWEIKANIIDILIGNDITRSTTVNATHFVFLF